MMLSFKSQVNNSDQLKSLLIKCIRSSCLAFASIIIFSALAPWAQGTLLDNVEITGGGLSIFANGSNSTYAGWLIANQTFRESFDLSSFYDLSSLPNLTRGFDFGCDLSAYCDPLNPLGVDYGLESGGEYMGVYANVVVGALDITLGGSTGVIEPGSFSPATSFTFTGDIAGYMETSATDYTDPTKVFNVEVSGQGYLYYPLAQPNFNVRDAEFIFTPPDPSDPPVPEPSTILLFATGVAGVAGLAGSRITRRLRAS